MNKTDQTYLNQLLNWSKQLKHISDCLSTLHLNDYTGYCWLYISMLISTYSPVQVQVQVGAFDMYIYI